MNEFDFDDIAVDTLSTCRDLMVVEQVLVFDFLEAARTQDEVECLEAAAAVEKLVAKINNVAWKATRDFAQEPAFKAITKELSEVERELYALKNGVAPPTDEELEQDLKDRQRANYEAALERDRLADLEAKEGVGLEPEEIEALGKNKAKLERRKIRAKRLYSKIAKLTHPDKQPLKDLHRYFVLATHLMDAVDIAGLKQLLDAVKEELAILKSPHLRRKRQEQKLEAARKALAEAQAKLNALNGTITHAIYLDCKAGRIDQARASYRMALEEMVKAKRQEVNAYRAAKEALMKTQLGRALRVFFQF